MKTTRFDYRREELRAVVDGMSLIVDNPKNIMGQTHTVGSDVYNYALTLDAVRELLFESMDREFKAFAEMAAMELAQFNGCAKYKTKQSHLLAEIENAKKIFIRSGKAPKSGKSRNFKDNSLEAGVSVYPAYKAGGKIIIDVRELDLASSMFILTRGADFYQIFGTELGVKGSDNEPLLIDVKKQVNVMSFEIEILSKQQ